MSYYIRWPNYKRAYKIMSLGSKGLISNYLRAGAVWYGRKADLGLELLGVSKRCRGAREMANAYS